MLKNKNGLALIILLFIINYSCSTKKNIQSANPVVSADTMSVFHTDTIVNIETKHNIYREAERLYHKQLREYEDILKDTEPFKHDSLYVNSRFVSAANFNLRKPNYIIIHHTAQDSVQQTLKTFALVSPQVSAHYVIGKDGEIIKMLNDYMRAWHCGNAKWGGISDMNSVSIGIELDNNGFEPFTESQLNSLMIVLEDLTKKYNIPSANIIGHSDIAPGRKQDPSIHFPWDLLAKKGFGRWFSDNLETPPANFSYIDALKVIGYDVTNPENVLLAFNIHYLSYQKDLNYASDSTKMVIYDLYKQQMGNVFYSNVFDRPSSLDTNSTYIKKYPVIQSKPKQPSSTKNNSKHSKKK